MFVVITLIADSKQPRTLREINAYATPAIVHFSAVLLTSAAVVLLLLSIGIHNAWDIVTCLVASQRQDS